MPDKLTLDVNRIWHDVREFADKTWNPETARGVLALWIGAANIDPNDSKNYYFGNFSGRAPRVDAGGYSIIYFPVAMLITRVDLNWWASGTAGSNEDVSLYLVINGTDEYLVATVGNTDEHKLFSKTDLEVAVEAGDWCEMKLATPAWATNPTSVSMGGNIFGWAA